MQFNNFNYIYIVVKYIFTYFIFWTYKTLYSRCIFPYSQPMLNIALFSVLMSLTHINTSLSDIIQYGNILLFNTFLYKNTVPVLLICLVLRAQGRLYQWWLLCDSLHFLAETMFGIHCCWYSLYLPEAINKQLTK